MAVRWRSGETANPATHGMARDRKVLMEPIVGEILMTDRLVIGIVRILSGAATILT
jgi:hypothetical protein